MGLKALRLPEEIVETPGGPLAVRGVSLADLGALVRHHGAALPFLFKDIMAGKNVTLNADLMTNVGQKALAAAPEIVAELIALASGDGDEESVAIAARLPVPTQLDAIEKIAKLTFITEGGLPKLLETIVRLAQGTTGAMTELQRPLTNGSGESARM